MMRKKPATALVYLLGAYVIIQFIWWGYLMIDLTRTSHMGNSLIAKRVIMIVGEGSVFLVLLALGLWRIQASIRKEMKMVRQQHNFMLSVTHELKTPVAASRLYLQTLVKHQLPEEKRIELMQKAIDETTRLEMLVEQILTASRLEHEKYVFQKERFDLHTFLCELISVQERRLHVPIQLQSVAGLQITTDRMALTTILNNLIENAHKYGQTEQGIELTVLRYERFLSIQVRDYGKGIAPTEGKVIFQKFVRLENEETRSAKGTGLGLYIAHEYTRALGGQLRLIQPEGPGACFEIQIPYE